MIPKPNVQSQPAARLPKSKATASTTAIQPLEITTTAVVMGDTCQGPEDPADSSTKQNSHELDGDVLHRKQSRHHHHHYLRSPASQATASVDNSPLVSPSGSMVSCTPPAISDAGFSVLPPPIIKIPSEAIAALQGAADASKRKATKRSPPSATTSDLVTLFESCFFSAVLLVQWSNIVGPKVEKIWSSEAMDERLQIMIGRQVLNGEVGRTVETVEPKWLVLYRQSIVCTAFLYTDPTAQSLCALIMVVPVRYLRNFSQYFHILRDRVPSQLIQPLIQLRKVHKRHEWPCALDQFTWSWLAPFIRSIMDLESVSLPIEYTRICHTILDHESRQLLDSPFIARVITSHLQTSGSTLIVGNSLTTINMMINTLALFLSPEERNRSSHARKNHKYMPDLYLQGILIQDMEGTSSQMERVVLESVIPTTIVDMTRLIVKQTLLLPQYHQLHCQYQRWLMRRKEDEASARPDSEWKKQALMHRTDSIAPIVQNLLDETRKVPTRLREGYVRQWHRGLVKRGLALVKYVQEEG
ncbi:hypothetical protein EC973_005413 [Apophysomyces ossiformis]|uniref:Uncharacterized protein n=1 Tax=Apophysomyces ossiformis TaxID=679940 RepID=A0A8H7BHD7_9FUNG|nr:hypothetical protein EC973_005413 [Apophysomyces ossiformis]